MQSRLQSFVETLANVTSGFIVSWCVGQVIYPMFGFNITPAQNVWIVAIFTVVSILRSYAWRRLFNLLHGRAQ